VGQARTAATGAVGQNPCMPPRKSFGCPCPVSYTSALSHASADKRIDVLRAVGASGSISQAARDCGVSYKAAWQAIDTLTNLAGAVLVERVVGGAPAAAVPGSRQRAASCWLRRPSWRRPGIRCWGGCRRCQRACPP
jgi:hypothetical protein